MSKPTRVDCLELPEHPLPDTIYVLGPRNFSPALYQERVKRGLGWISPEEQTLLHESAVCLCGCGGMGGLIAEMMVRIGIGVIILCDPDTFDRSNINRQAAAKSTTIGKLKAIETARHLRAIAEDTTVIVCTTSLTEDVCELIREYILTCDLFFDEIELFAIEGRLTLHTIAGARNVPLLNCNTVGYRTYLFYFSNETMSLREAMGFTPETEAAFLQCVRDGMVTSEKLLKYQHQLIKILIPEVPEYSKNLESFSTVENWHDSILRQEVMVTSTNPPGASGFVASHAVLYLLRTKSHTARKVITPPLFPGYLMIDFALMESRIVTTPWF